MDEHFFDDLAKGLDSGSVSRGRALRLVGAGILAAMVPPLFPRPAVADARKRCRRKGDTYVSRGECHCAYNCGLPTPFACPSYTGCSCVKSVYTGRGVCADVGTGHFTLDGCDKTTSCGPFGVCAVFDCPPVGGGGNATARRIALTHVRGA